VILQQEHEGYNWHTDDPAHLYISNTGHLPQEPKQVTAFIIGRGGVVRPATRVLKLETLKFMGCGLRTRTLSTAFLLPQAVALAILIGKAAQTVP
jgi:hypothetical protein